MAYDIDWQTVDEQPTDNSKANKLDTFVKRVADAIAERLTNQFYGFAQGETEEGVKRLEFINQADDPVASRVSYTKNGEAFFKDGVDNIVQISNGENVRC